MSRGLRYPRDEVTIGSEPPDMGGGHQIWVLYRNRTVSPAPLDVL